MVYVCCTVRNKTELTQLSSNSALPDDGDYTEICRSCFNVNFNTPFKAILLCISWWIKDFVLSILIIIDYLSDRLSVTNSRISYFLTVPISTGQTPVYGFLEYFIHLVVRLTIGPKPLPKRALHIVRSRASSFKWEYPLLSLRSSNSFLRLLLCLPVTSIPPSRRQILRKMWPIQFASRLRISCRIFLCLEYYEGILELKKTD